MATAYLLLGTNLGCRSDYLKSARNDIQEEVGLLSQISSIYETEAWGKKDQADYLNQVLIVQTTLPPLQLLETTSQIENRLGRERRETWGPRTIDIDLLFYDEKVLASERLTLPHPHIPNRRFVLTPLNEIAPELIHPKLNKSIHDLLKACQDPLWVKKYEEIPFP